ncbi:hypothetical protein KJ780_03945, partial [Candidatus Micrarchaeota archaeon]|nr:hypothetical protein [Candidatus Micrarchaeota archaeon]
MAKKQIMYGLGVIGIVFMAGCCGCGLTEPSTSCSLGTYGEACTNLCNSGAGSDMGFGSDCFSSCMEQV